MTPRFTSGNTIFVSPHYLRYKTGLGEAFAAAIFKPNKGQELPLTRYINALPDMSFFVVSIPKVFSTQDTSRPCVFFFLARLCSNPRRQEVITNDLLSFRKEELAGETWSLYSPPQNAGPRSSSSYNGSDPCGEWIVLDMICLLCDV